VRQCGIHQPLSVQPWREPAAQRHRAGTCRLRLAGQPEAGPVGQVGFGDSNPGGGSVCEQRQPGHGLDRQIGEPLSAELPLLRALEAAARVVILGRNRDVVAGEADVVRGEGELRELLVDREINRAFAGEHVAEAHAVIEGAEYHGKSPAGVLLFTHGDGELSVVVADLAPFPERVSPGGVAVCARRVHQHHFAAEHAPGAQAQAEPRLIQERRAIDRHAVTEDTRSIYRHGNAAVGRAQLEGRRGGCCLGRLGFSTGGDKEDGREGRRPPVAAFAG